MPEHLASPGGPVAAQGASAGGGATMHEGEENSLTVRDNRTGKEYHVPISDGAVRGMDFRQMKVSYSDFGLLVYDPAFQNTASCKSRITFIDGDRGILRYRGYPIEELAEKKSYLEVANLVIHGELPTPSELEEWNHNIT